MSIKYSIYYTLESVGEILKCDLSDMLYTVVIEFVSVDEILKCDLSDVTFIY